ncbi:MAG: DNA polymerase III subunit delta' [Dehalococcoidales bacterium]|nr:MAG: DNA polymerase III subunit delta' [Dehalococcoidales bacterium]
MWQILGQDRAVALLQRSLEVGSVSHAYMFIGPAHSGKMTLAMDLARALNCEGDEIPCGQCEPCSKVTDLKHADVQVVGIAGGDPSTESRSKTEISIEQIRQIQHTASLPPFEGKYRIYIIENAESLSVEAANALLKTLEEPESKIVFVLLVTDSSLLLETGVSRCQPVEFIPVPSGIIMESLTGNWGIEPGKATLLARLSRGRFGWAVSAARDDSLVEQRSEMVENILDVIDGNIETRFALSTQLASKFNSDRNYVFERLDILLDLWRDMLLIKTGSTDNITNIDRIDELTRMAEGRSLSRIRNFIRSIQKANVELRQNANPRLVLEVLMIDVPDSSQGREAVSSDTR